MMSSEREFDEGIKSIKSAWRREHTARTNLERMLEQAESENERLRRAAERDADVMEALVSYIDDSRVDGVCEDNAKLRELVRDLRIQLSCAYDSKELVEYDERLKELGIEMADD